MDTLLANLKLLLGTTGTTEDSLLTLYLNTAGQKILDRLYPFDSTQTTVPAKYQTKQVEIAQYLYLKRGAEGETSHNENGINRAYESADVPESLMRGIVPYCGLPIAPETTA